MAQSPEEQEKESAERASRFLKEAQASWATAYDLLRPASEVDSRAKSVLVVSLALIALSLSAQKPESISLLGISFQAGHWLVLGIPLAVVHLYYIAQLTLAWQVHRGKTDNAIASPIVSVSDGFNALRAKEVEELRLAQEKRREMHRRRSEIWDSYTAERERLPKLNDLPPEEAFKSFENYQNREMELKQLEDARDARLREAGVEEYDERVKAFMDARISTTGKGGDALRDPGDIAMDDAIMNMKRVVRMRRARTILDVAIPAMVAVFALYIFTMAVFMPRHLNALSVHLSKVH